MPVRERARRAGPARHRGAAGVLGKGRSPLGVESAAKLARLERELSELKAAAKGGRLRKSPPPRSPGDKTALRIFTLPLRICDNFSPLARELGTVDMEAVAKQTCQLVAVAVVAQVAGTARTVCLSGEQRQAFPLPTNRHPKIWMFTPGGRGGRLRTSGGVPGAWEKCPKIWIMWDFSTTMWHLTRSSPKSDLWEAGSSRISGGTGLTKLCRGGVW